MIRDPSDGSVRGKPVEGKSLATAPEPAMPADQNRPRDAAPPVSGLPAGSAKPEQIERLNESRKWLKDYQAKKTHGGTDGQ